jgi:hypothetical protein
MLNFEQFEFVEAGRTADPSTALRSGRDDKGSAVTFPWQLLVGAKCLEVKTRSFPTSQNRDVGHPQLLLPGRPFKFGFAEFAYALERVGGADRDRTGDPLLAKQVLSQLSYSPLTLMVGLGRFELPTSPLSGVRSNQLSYRPAGCARVS